MTSTNQDTKTKSSLLEVADSVTGFEEIEVTERFGRPLGDLQFTDGAMWARALVFTLKRREKVVDADAHNQALSLAVKDVWSYFAKEDAESGKDDQTSETPPPSSPPSAT